MYMQGTTFNRILPRRPSFKSLLHSLFIIYLFSPLADYHCHRLKVGVAEGMDEIPVGGCFPLEYNLDYLNGGL